MSRKKLRALERFVSKLKAASSLTAEQKLLESSDDLLDFENESDSDTKLVWSEVKRIGLIPLLFELLCRPLDVHDTNAIFIHNDATALLYNATQRDGRTGRLAVKDDEMQQLIRQRGGAFLHNVITKQMKGRFGTQTQLLFIFPALRMLHEWFSADPTRAWESDCDKELVLRFIFYLYLDSGSAFRHAERFSEFGSPPEEQDRIRRMMYCFCSAAFSSFVGTKAENMEAVTQAIAKYGERAVAEQCLNMVEVDKEGAQLIQLGALQLTLTFGGFKYFQQALCDFGVSAAVVRGYWKRARFETYGIGNALSLSLSILEATLEYCPSNDLREEICGNLLLHHDLLYLIGKGLLWSWNSQPISGFAKNSQFPKHILGYLKKNPEDKHHTRISSAVAHVYATLLQSRSLHSGPSTTEDDSQPTDAAEWWSAYFEIVYPEAFDRLQKTRQENAATKSDSTPDLEPVSDCYWVECPRYGHVSEETGRTKFRCATCKKALYCSLRCQRADWDEGGHSTSCSGSSDQLMPTESAIKWCVSSSYDISMRITPIVERPIVIRLDIHMSKASRHRANEPIL